MAKSETMKKSGSGLMETLSVIVQALLIALIIRTFLYQPFYIPSPSMVPTLKVSDYLFVSKFSYGYSRYTFEAIPYVPLSLAPFEGRIWIGEIERGDIAVFRPPGQITTDYIKRVVGLPGDTIQMKGGQLFINGEAVPRVNTRQSMTYYRSDGSAMTGTIFRETLPNGVSYDTLDVSPINPSDNTPLFTVPPGHYFMMGDNRDDSSDSRVPGSGVGMVPFENFIGKAEIIFFSVDEKTAAWKFWTWPWTLRWDRFFTML